MIPETGRLSLPFCLNSSYVVHVLIQSEHCEGKSRKRDAHEPPSCKSSSHNSFLAYIFQHDFMYPINYIPMYFSTLGSNNTISTLKRTIASSQPDSR